MKKKNKRIKSYDIIFIFETAVMILLILSNFKNNLTNVYKLPLILLILDFLFFLILGYEKKNKRLNKEVTFDLFLYSMIFLIIYYLSGIVISFAKSNNYLTLYGLTVFIIPTILTIVFKEHFRNSLLTKSGDNKFLIFYTFLLFIIIDILVALSILNLSNSYEIFLFIALTLLPSITTNILATYVSSKVGYLPMIIYLLVLSLYKYIIPIIPNPNEYLKAIIDFILPIVVLFRIKKTIDKYSDKEVEINRNYGKIVSVLVIIPILIIGILVYFISGYFKYYALAIASGSMRPVFDKGSVVIVEQINKDYDNYDKIKKGDIIAFKTDKAVVVHRLIRIIKTKDEVFYYTKGDANKDEDNYLIKNKDIIGVVKFKIPYIGYPTVWFSGL